MTRYGSLNCVATAMKPCEADGELFSLDALTGAPDFGTHILELLPAVGVAATADVTLELFQRILALLGADAGVFLSFVRDDATHASYRTLYACDPLWACEYAARNWYDKDPWLRYAVLRSEPILGSQLELLPPEQEFVRISASLGFASTIVAPAPTSAGSSRVGVLCLGSHNIGFFEGASFDKVRVLARALAMELHGWLLQTIKQELMARSRITPADLDLLRHEDAGHSSKVIAAAMKLKPETVDCRFQRVSAKLKAADRRSATRIAKLYGLI
jgi:hypothetical protein